MYWPFVGEGGPGTVVGQLQGDLAAGTKVEDVSICRRDQVIPSIVLKPEFFKCEVVKRVNCGVGVLNCLPKSICSLPSPRYVCRTWQRRQGILLK